MTEDRRTYYAIDDAGVVVTHMRSARPLAEFVAAVRSKGSTLDWTANPTSAQLEAYDRRLADADA